MLGRFVCGFLVARADRRNLELRKRAQGWNVGIAPPAVAHIGSNDANPDFLCAMMILLKRALYSDGNRSRPSTILVGRSHAAIGCPE